MNMKYINYLYNLNSKIENERWLERESVAQKYFLQVREHKAKEEREAKDEQVTYTIIQVMCMCVISLHYNTLYHNLYVNTIETSLMRMNTKFTIHFMM